MSSVRTCSFRRPISYGCPVSSRRRNHFRCPLRSPTDCPIPKPRKFGTSRWTVARQFGLYRSRQNAKMIVATTCSHLSPILRAFGDHCQPTRRPPIGVGVPCLSCLCSTAARISCWTLITSSRRLSASLRSVASSDHPGCRIAGAAGGNPRGIPPPRRPVCRRPDRSPCCSDAARLGGTRSFGRAASTGWFGVRLTWRRSWGSLRCRGRDGRSSRDMPASVCSFWSLAYTWSE